jgi:hypothetical protein
MLTVIVHNVQAISVTQAGKPAEKLELAFRLYDIDRNGTIDQQEMTDIIKVISNGCSYRVIVTLIKHKLFYPLFILLRLRRKLVGYVLYTPHVVFSPSQLCTSFRATETKLEALPGDVCLGFLISSISCD